MLFRSHKLVTEVKWPIRSSFLFPCQSVLCQFRISLKLEKTRLASAVFSNTAFYPFWANALPHGSWWSHCPPTWGKGDGQANPFSLLCAGTEWHVQNYRNLVVSLPCWQIIHHRKVVLPPRPQSLLFVEKGIQSEKCNFLICLSDSWVMSLMKLSVKECCQSCEKFFKAYACCI